MTRKIFYRLASGSLHCKPCYFHYPHTWGMEFSTTHSDHDMTFGPIPMSCCWPSQHNGWKGNPGIRSYTVMARNDLTIHGKWLWATSIHPTKHIKHIPNLASPYPDPQNACRHSRATQLKGKCGWRKAKMEIYNGLKPIAVKILYIWRFIKHTTM